MASTGCAQAAQNFAVARTEAPQLGQVRPSGAAHSSQKRASVGFSCWQREHFISVLNAEGD